jgi:hypothetical protein
MNDKMVIEQFAIPSDARLQLDQLVSLLREIATATLIGVYLHGSALANGADQPGLWIKGPAITDVMAG